MRAAWSILGKPAGCRRGVTPQRRPTLARASFPPGLSFKRTISWCITACRRRSWRPPCCFPFAVSPPIPRRRDFSCTRATTSPHRQHAGRPDAARRLARDAASRAASRQDDLVFRNLAFSGDEVDLKNRLRSDDFGTPDEWLTKTKADVIFAFFGYNESFAGERGSTSSRTNSDDFIKHTLAPEVQRQGAPRLVLFSPIAHENLNDPNLPDGTRTTRTSSCTPTRWPRSPRHNSVPFVDLFDPRRAVRQGRQAADDQRHPPERDGDHDVAQHHRQALFGARRRNNQLDKVLERLRLRGPRQELLLVQPLPHARRLQRLRRPGAR